MSSYRYRTTIRWKIKCGTIEYLYNEFTFENLKRVCYTKIFKEILHEYSNLKSVYLICYFLDESDIICSMVKI